MEECNYVKVDGIGKVDSVDRITDTIANLIKSNRIKTLQLFSAEYSTPANYWQEIKIQVDGENVNLKEEVKKISKLKKNNSIGV